MRSMISRRIVSVLIVLLVCVLVIPTQGFAEETVTSVPLSENYISGTFTAGETLCFEFEIKGNDVAILNAEFEDAEGLTVEYVKVYYSGNTSSAYDIPYGVDSEDNAFVTNYCIESPGDYTYRLRISADSGSYRFKIARHTGTRLYSLSCGLDSYRVGEKVAFQATFRGDTAFDPDNIESMTWTVYEKNTGNVAATWNGIAETYVYTADTVGEYYCTVEMTEKSGPSWEAGSKYGSGFTVKDGLWLENVTQSPNGSSSGHVYLGEPVTFTAVTSGEGTVENVKFEIITGYYDDVVAVHEGTDLSYTYTCNDDSLTGQFNWFECRVTLTNDLGYTSTATQHFDVGNGLFISDFYLTKGEEYDYALGEAISYTLVTEGNGTVDNILYEIYVYEEESAEETVIYSLNTTEKTFSYTPTTTGNVHCRVTLTDNLGNSDYGYGDVYCAVRDPNFRFRGAYTDNRQYKAGEPITFKAVIEGEGEPASITFSVSHGESYEDEFTQTGLDRSCTVTLTESGYYYCSVEVEDQYGTVYGDYVSILVIDGEGCSIVDVSPSSDTIELGQSITITPVIEGTGDYEIEYEFYRNGYTYTVEGENLPSATYTPPAAGSYMCYVYVTSNGNTTHEYCLFDVTDGLYPTAVNFDKETIQVGEPVTVTVDTAGTGDYTSIRYRLFTENGYGENFDYYWEGKSTSATLTPTVAGAYWCEVSLVNDRGAVYTIQSEDNLNVADESLRLVGISVSPTDRKAGEPVTLKPVVDGEGTATSIMYELYRWGDGGMPGWYNITLDGFSFIPWQSGTYRCTMWLTNDKGITTQKIIDFDVQISGEDTPTTEPRKVTALTPEKTEYTLGETMKVTAEMTGSSEIEAMEYHVYNSQGQHLTGYAGISGTYSFTPNAADTYILRVYMKAEGGDWHSVDSVPVTVKAPVEEDKPLTAVGLIPSKLDIKTGETVYFDVDFEGQGNPTFMQFYTYNKAGEQLSSWTGITGRYGFYTYEPGEYAIRLFMYTDAEPDKLQVITSPFFKVATDDPLHIVSLIPDDTDIQVGEQITFKVNFEGEGKPIFMRFYTYNIAGEQLGFYEGVAGEYGFISSIPGQFAIRVFMYTDVEPDNLQEITSPFFTVTAPETAVSAAEEPVAEEPVIDEPSAEEPEIPEEPAEPETSEEPEEPEVPEVPEEPEESVTEDEGSEPEVETEEEISEETPEVTQKETSEETTEEPSEEPSEEVPESEITE